MVRAALHEPRLLFVGDELVDLHIASAVRVGQPQVSIPLPARDGDVVVLEVLVGGFLCSECQLAPAIFAGESASSHVSTCCQLALKAKLH
jgi:hypothetical protein